MQNGDFESASRDDEAEADQIQPLPKPGKKRLRRLSTYESDDGIDPDD